MKKVVNVIIVLFILLFGYFCFYKYIMKVNYVPFGSYKVVTIPSDSMKPVVSAGDAVFIKSVGEYKKGDVICYESYSVLNIRTIVKIDNETVIVRENYTGNEDTIKRYDIVGKMEKRIPNLGNILKLLTEPWILLFVGILIGSYFAFVYAHK